MGKFCERQSAPFALPKLVCRCAGPPSLMSGTGIPDAEAKLCRNCGTEPRTEGTQSAVSVCVLAANHRGRCSWARRP